MYFFGRIATGRVFFNVSRVLPFGKDHNNCAASTKTQKYKAKKQSERRK